MSELSDEARAVVDRVTGALQPDGKLMVRRFAETFDRLQDRIKRQVDNQNRLLRMIDQPQLTRDELRELLTERVELADRHAKLLTAVQRLFTIRGESRRLATDLADVELVALEEIRVTMEQDLADEG